MAHVVDVDYNDFDPAGVEVGLLYAPGVNLYLTSLQEKKETKLSRMVKISTSKQKKIRTTSRKGG